MALIAGVAARETLCPAEHSHTCSPACSDCVPFVNDGSNETDKSDVERKRVAVLDELELLKHGPSRGGAAEQLDAIGFGCFAQHSRHFEDESGPHRFDHTSRLHQPFLVRSAGVDDTTEFYCMLYGKLIKSADAKRLRLTTVEMRRDRWPVEKKGDGGAPVDRAKSTMR